MSPLPESRPRLQLELLHEWKHLMHSGLDASRESRLVLAQGHYLRALDIARALLVGRIEGAVEVDDDDRIATFVVTSLNLAESFVDAGRPEIAMQYLCEAHGSLIALLRGASASPSLQVVACRHLRETHAALVRHWSEHGEHPAITASLRAGCMPFPAQGPLH